ncbi:MAG: hypothetical protein JWO31_2692 [Phycisphaerales bacterium]|nr:hypothetical protein [Phycisphaerales bacterium]
MPTARDEIELFLLENSTGEFRRLDVAIVYAESMLQELEAAVLEWEQAAAGLRRQRGESNRCARTDGAYERDALARCGADLSSKRRK